MVTSILTLVPPAGSEARSEIKNARLARDRIEVLIATLKTQRSEARAAFLRVLGADLAALKDTPTKAFVDAAYAKYTTSNHSDKELENRIQAFESLAPLLDAHVKELAEKYHADFIALLTEERAALELQREKEDEDKSAVEASIAAVEAELAKWSTPAPATTKRASATAKAKSAAKKAKNPSAPKKAAARRK
jgi:hypothetical protein